MTFDAAKCRVLGPQVAEALQDFAKQHGLVVRYGGGSYDADTFKAKIVFEAVLTPEQIEEKQKREFTTYCKIFGLEPTHYGATFTNGGKSFRLIAVDLGKPKYPIIAICVETGKRHKFVESVVAKITKKAAA